MIDEEKVLSHLFGIDRLRCSLVSNNKVINKYWFMSISLPSGRRGMVAVVNYKDGYAGVFTSDFNYVSYMLANAISTNTYHAVSRSIDNDPVMPLFEDLNLYSSTQEDVYGAPSYTLNIVIPQCLSKITCYYAPRINLDPVVAQVRILSKQISIEVTSEYDDEFWKDWIG